MPHFIYQVAKLFKFSLRRNPLLVLCPLLGILASGFELAAMISLGPLSAVMTDGQLPTQDVIVRTLQYVGITPNIAVLIQLFAGLFILRFILGFFSQSLGFYYSKRIYAQLNQHAFAILSERAPIEKIQQESIGHTLEVIGGSALRASQLIAELNQLFAVGVLSILYFYAIMRLSMPLAISVVLFIGVTGAMSLGVFKKLQQLGARQITQAAQVTNVFLDTLNGLRTVRTFGVQRFLADLHFKEKMQYAKTLFWLDFLPSVLKLLPISCIFIVLLGLSIRYPEQIAALDYTVVIMAIFFLLRFFPTIGQTFTIMMKALGDAKAIEDVLAVQDWPLPTVGHQHQIGPISQLSCVNVTYRYDNHTVLSHFNYSFERGKSYAIIGPSGCGKSTLFNLLSGMSQPCEGQVCVNGQPLSDFSPDAIAQKILLVDQHVALFQDTLYHNIAFGQDIDKAHIAAVCQTVGLADVIAQGLDKPLAYRGENLSGGQRQRVGLARALVRQADILLLDESTSALDAQTRDQVIDTILARAQEKIVIFVTHDATLAAWVDEVIDFTQSPTALCA